MATSAPPEPPRGSDLPSGLMVLSAAAAAPSFSLELPPLDMRAAMEKALARDES